VKRLLLMLTVLATAQAATLERMSLDEVIGKSTAIVRGRVAGSYVAQHGQVIYTHYTIAVTERLKGLENGQGVAGGQADVVVAGGTIGRTTQTFPGSPSLVTGQEYVFCLWKGKSGLTHVMGLSQGLFDVKTDASSGEVTISRGATDSVMLDGATGRPVMDRPVRMRLRDFNARVTGAVKKD
jgi:hypothetical protein